jgi:hypothetical protein
MPPVLSVRGNVLNERASSKLPLMMVFPGGPLPFSSIFIGIFAHCRVGDAGKI